MRLRNVKNAKYLISNDKYMISSPEQYKGSWQKLFSNNNPIYLEIGMGKGKFILENALKFPNINFIGIEKYDSVMARAIEKIDTYELSNLKLIIMDANNIVDIFDKEINRIYLNFSDPWPKHRHASRRLTSEEFLNLYDKVFSKHEEIFMKTDNKDLFLYSVDTLTKHGYKVRSNYFDNFDLSNHITTEYEDKFRQNNYYIYELEATRE